MLGDRKMVTEHKYNCYRCQNIFDTEEHLEFHVCPVEDINTNYERTRKLEEFAKRRTDLEKLVSTQEHYTQFPIQVMEFCHVNNLSWCAANVVKYVCREGKKDGIKDLYKAMDYLKCLIHFKETGIFLPPNKLAEVKK